MTGSGDPAGVRSRGEDGAAPRGPDPRGAGRWPYGAVVAVLVVGVLVTAGLVALSLALNASNESRLLHLRAKEVGAALTAAVPETQTPLGAAAALADSTRITPARFRAFARPYAGPPGGHPFVSLSLWRAADPGAGPVVVAGVAPELSPRNPGTIGFLRRADAANGLTVTAMLHGSRPRIGYAYSGFGDGRYVAYGEAALAPRRYARLPPNSAYANVNVVVYLGRRATPAELLLTTARPLPLTGRVARTEVGFGDTALTVLVAARQPLGGSLPQDLPWAIGIIGALLTLGASLLTTRLISDRRRAQRLAQENRHLYSEQRDIAQTLQHALLPDVLPRIRGIELGGRYQAGEAGMEVGGDWYDLIELDARRLLLVVGDVSGRGLKAATAMASLRFAIHYAAGDDPPEVFLPKLSGMRRLRESGLLATVMCALIDLPGREVSITSAGHLPPLLIANGASRFLEPKVGLPVGVDEAARYVPASFSLPPSATLLGYTDGLVERRDEVLDTGLERLREAAVGAGGAGGAGSLDELMGRILSDVRGPASLDDTAMAGVRWVR